MKKCTLCKAVKPLDDFHWKNKSKGVKNSQCKTCKINYAKTHYKINKEKYVASAVRCNKRNKDEVRLFLVEYLKAHPCVDCGENDIIVLEADHIDPKTKLFNIGEAIRKSYSVKKVKQELDKCEIRCANCHRRKTARQFGNYKLAGN